MHPRRPALLALCTALNAAFRPARRDLIPRPPLRPGFYLSINHVLSLFLPSLPSVPFSPLPFCLSCADL